MPVKPTKAPLGVAEKKARQLRAEMEKKRMTMTENALVILEDLHEEGFRHLLLESTQVGNEDYWLKIFVNEDTISYDRMKTLYEVAELNGANVFMDELRMNQRSVSRMAVWPRHA